MLIETVESFKILIASIVSIEEGTSFIQTALFERLAA